MKVLIVGFCKTGTKSVEKACEILGYKVSPTIRTVSELSSDWERFMGGEGTPTDLRRMFEGFDVVSDSPGYFFWREFVEAFPDIKLIFMTRDEDTWWRSNKRQMEADGESVSLFQFIFSSNAKAYFRFFSKVFQRFYQAKSRRFILRPRYPEVTEENMRKAYRDHNQDIMKNAPRKQLLLFNLKEGWRPLCEFLNLEQPNIPFPHENKNAQWAKDVKMDPYFREMKSQAWRNFILLLIVGFGVIGVLINFFINN